MKYHNHYFKANNSTIICLKVVVSNLSIIYLLEKECEMNFDKFLNQREKVNNNLYMIDIIKSKPIPKHICIIMDGNGRWAEKRDFKNCRTSPGC